MALACWGVAHQNVQMPHVRELDWLQRTVGVLPLHERSVISVHGDDAHEWLKGQITNQSEGAGPGDCVYAFILTLKGRVLADAWALFHEEGVWLDVPVTQVEALLERLDRYIIMEDVELGHRPDLRLVAAQGPRAAQIAEGGWPVDRLGVGGRQWAVETAALDETWARTKERAEELDGGMIDEDAWAYAHVVRGRPRFGLDFGDWTYPQETGLTPIAVSFTKGCYIGQETVVMLQNRGKAPKTLWRWSVEGHSVPAPKTPIVRAGTPVGELASAVSTDEGVTALGFLKRGFDPEEQEFQIAGRRATAIGSVAAGIEEGSAAT